jgi:hypothetical protein
MRHYSSLPKKKKKKKGNPLICDNMDEPGERYVKWNKPGTERYVPHDLTYMWNLQMPNKE